MTYRILTAASLVALLAGCSHEAPRMSASEAALSAYLSGDYATAERAYGAILASDPSNASALLGMGETMEATGRANEAADFYQRAYAVRSGSIRVWDAGVQQDGVTEVAYRRLSGMSGHAPSYTAPVAAPTSLPNFEEPTYATPTIPAEPIYSEPTYAEPAYAEPSYSAPAYVEPTYSEPTYTPVQTQPVYTQPAYAEPIYQQPSYVEPTYSAPAYGEPTYTQPAYSEPAYAPPAYTEPSAYGAPAYTAPPRQSSYALDDEGYVSYTYPSAERPIREDVFDSLDSAVDAIVAPRQTPPAQQPMQGNASNGYTIVNGVVEYSTDAPQYTPMPVPARETVTYETMPVNFGTPVDVISSGVPTQTPENYSAPRGVDVQNGVPMIQLGN